ncbi:MAG: hypothetical protein QXQ36_07190 [Sulfolobales archaeon]
MEDILQAIEELIKEIIVKTVGVIFSGISFMAEQIRNAIVTPFSGILNTIQYLIRSIFDRFVDEIYTMYRNTVDWIRTVFYLIYTRLSEAVNKLTDVLNQLKNIMIESVKSIVDGFSKIAETITSRFIEGFKLLQEKLGEILEKFRETFETWIQTLKEVGENISEMFTSLILLLKEYLEKIVKLFKIMIKYLKKIFELNPEEVGKVVVEIQKALMGLTPTK